MLDETMFGRIAEKAKLCKYSSMNYIDFDDCKNAEVLHDRDGLILLRDTSKTPSMLYFAADDFEALVKMIAGIPGKLRLHFVPREYAERLTHLGFAEWGEYTDFWNNSLADTVSQMGEIEEMEVLGADECAAAADITQKCRMQSRGFEGESPAWFAEWLKENKVIIRRVGSAIAGVCCVSIYNGGTTLWIREIAVDPRHQGKGIGKRLMEQAIKYGADNGAERGFLAADILNQNAIGLYQKYGFSATGTDCELQMMKA
ncbi:MAG: GNAT family N-acetyltransferase [Oscillospiraceae bacterium]|nr:GNAT family N-acetyltransferase [Oscillospiraceae bacterium]